MPIRCGQPTLRNSLRGLRLRGPPLRGPPLRGLRGVDFMVSTYTNLLEFATTSLPVPDDIDCKMGCSGRHRGTSRNRKPRGPMQTHQKPRADLTPCIRNSAEDFGLRFLAVGLWVQTGLQGLGLGCRAV